MKIYIGHRNFNHLKTRSAEMILYQLKHKTSIKTRFCLYDVNLISLLNLSDSEFAEWMSCQACQRKTILKNDLHTVLSSH